MQYLSGMLIKVHLKIKLVHNSFVNLADLKSGSDDGIVSAIQSSFEGIGISIDDLCKKFVGFGADGAAVNQGGERGAISSLRESYGLWILFVWCVSHCLELSIKDVLKGTPFEDIEEMLLDVYYMYKNFPKKLRELKSIHDEYKGLFEFEEGLCYVVDITNYL